MFASPSKRAWLILPAAAIACFSFSTTILAQGRGGGPPPEPPPNPTSDPLLKGFVFRSIGPAVMMGRADDVEGSEKDPMLIYAGFATGGVWKSTDGGYHWKSLWDNMPNESVGSIGISPSNPDVVYVGTGEGNNRQSSSIGNGVWGTKDGGKTWEHMGLENTQSIQRVVVDPTNPNIAFVAAGGHLFGPNPDRGLYKTTDGGKTWKKAKYIDENTGFTDVTIDPKNPKIVFAASYMRRRTWWGFNGGGPNSGLWKSTDGGDNWTRIDGPGWPKPKDGIYGRIAVSIFRSNPNIVYAQVEAGAGAGTGGGTAADGGPSRGRGGFAAAGGGEGAADNPAEAGAAAGRGADGARGGGGGGGGEGGNGCTMVPGAGGGFGGGGGGGGGRGAAPVKPNPDGNGVFRSEDGGKTWKQMDGCDDRPMYFSQIRVDPKDDQKIFTGGNPARVSHDGGKTWTNLTGSHTDYHGIYINPNDPRIVWVGHDGGLDSSNDGGVTFLYHNDIAVGQFYQVSADMRRPYFVCGGLQDNNAWCGPSALRSNTGPSNEDWYTIAGGDGFYTRQDPTDWAIAYGESQDGSMSRHDLRNGTQKSIQPRVGGRGEAAGTPPSAEPSPAATNAGAVEPAGGAAGAAGAAAPAGAGRGGGGGGGRGGAPNVVNAPPDIAAFRFYWNAPFEISPHNPAVIYMASQYFFKSTNRGDTWTMNPKDLSKNVNRWAPEQAIMGVSGEKPMASKHDGYAASSLATQVRESPSRPGVIWIGTDDGNLQVSQDGGNEFANVINNILGAPKGYVQISRIEPSHFDPGTCYVALDNHRNDDFKPYLFKTTDYGRSWTNLTSNLPANGNINALREDYDNPNLLFVGTEFGLYITLDQGREWKQFMTGLPSVRVDDILIHPRDRDLIIGTHGRSIWIADDITPLEQMTPKVGAADVTLFEPRAAVQWKNDPQAQRHIKNVEFTGRNPQGGTAITVLAKSDLGQGHIDFLENNVVMSTMQVDIKAGMNRFQWPMTGIAGADAAAAGGGRGGRNGGGGGRRGGAGAAGAAAPGAAAGEAAAPAAPVNPDAAAQFGGGGGRGRGGAGGGVPFVSGGRGGGGGFGGGGGGAPVTPGTYMVRLTVGEKTYMSSVDVLEDIWMRPQ
jgi:photosystem II stability/assembly factor-like uncharacterized protein